MPSSILSARAASRLQRGFTLVELITTLLVLAILIVVGAGSLRNTVSSNTLYAVENEIVAAFALARSEAAARGLNVVVAPAAPVTGNEFGGGWTVFADLNEDGSQQSGEPQLRRHEALSPETVARTNGPTSIAFAPTGFVTPAGMTISVCANGGSSTPQSEYEIRVEPTGLTDVRAITC